MASIAAHSSRHRLNYGDEVIEFHVRRQPSRAVDRVAIHVEPDGQVLVDVPAAAAMQDVTLAVRKRARWISQRVAAAKMRRAHILPREYVSGEALHYLGRRYRLKVVVDADAAPGARMRGAFIVVNVQVRSFATIRATLDAWYRLRAREIFAARLAAVAVPLHWIKKLPFTRLQFMTIQWGSCSPTGRITLNPQLVKAPRECIDYVLLHELCHLLHHNHSPKFYKTLDRYMPGWRTLKERLDGMAEEIFRA